MAIQGQDVQQENYLERLGIKARISVSIPDDLKRTKARLYIHNAGLDFYSEGHGTSEIVKREILERIYPPIEEIKTRNAFVHALDVLTNPEFPEFDYVIGIIWARKRGKIKKEQKLEKMIDWFGWRGLDTSIKADNWVGNPDIYSLITINSFIKLDDKNMEISEISCGDGAIILGEEERYRRTTKNLNEFASKPPEVRGLNLDTDLIIANPIIGRWKIPNLE
jgi:hypothetical protein